MSKRRHARERVMQALYAQLLGGADPEHCVSTIIKPRLGDDTPTYEFARNLFLKCVDHEAESTAIIEEHTQNWDVARIAVVDRVIIQMAIVEFLYFDDVPPKVTMNELIEIAKKYSTEGSGRFVNGILDAVLADLMKKGRINKKGRGLVGMANSSKVKTKAE